MKFRLAVLALTFCLLTAFGQAPPKQPKGDPNQPAGERYKNVQILKTVPAGQFIGYMRSFNAALGVECGFCHAQDRSSDEKEEKKMARVMLTMVHEVNDKYFKGEMEVKCYTCHKGASHPVSEAPTAATAPAPPSAEKK